MIGPLEALEPSRRVGGTVPSQVIEVNEIRPLARPEALAVAGQEYERTSTSFARSRRVIGSVTPNAHPGRSRTWPPTSWAQF